MIGWCSKIHSFNSLRVFWVSLTWYLIAGHFRRSASLMSSSFRCTGKSYRATELVQLPLDVCCVEFIFFIVVMGRRNIFFSFFWSNDDVTLLSWSPTCCWKVAEFNCSPQEDSSPRVYKKNDSSLHRSWLSACCRSFTKVFKGAQPILFGALQNYK